MTGKIYPEQHYLDTISGHDTVKSYLVSAMHADCLPHALLFHGPAGVGKLSMAYALAKRMNCLQDSPEGCLCNMCRKIAETKFADILIVEPKGATGSITLNGWRPGKDDPDGLQYYRFVETRPLEGSRKVLVFRRAERMNVALANYILKLMEEPPPYLTIVLISDRKSELLPTIRSRCASVKFSPLAMEEMKDFATRRGMTPSSPEVETTLRYCEGKPGALDDKIADTAATDQEDLAAAMLMFRKHGFVGLFRAASDFLDLGESGGTDAGSRFEASLNKMSTWFRDALVIKTGADDSGQLLAYPALSGQLRQFAEDVSAESMVKASEAIASYKIYARRQTDKNYALECLLMEIGRIIRG